MCDQFSLGLETPRIGCELELATTQIRAHEPLFVKVRLVNNTPDDVILKAPMGCMFGTVTFETANTIGGMFTPVMTKNQGTLSPSPIRTVIRPNHTYVSYEVLFVYRDKFIFAMPGSYFVRTRVKVGNEFLFSSPVRIQVVTSPDAMAEMVARDRPKLVRLVGTGVQMGGLADTRATQPLHDALDNSVLRDTIGWIAAVNQLAEDAELPDIGHRVKRLNELTTLQSSVVQDVARLAAARRLTYGKRYDIAKSMLEMVQEASYDRDVLLQLISH